jgi:hypothetical protein
MLLRTLSKYLAVVGILLAGYVTSVNAQDRIYICHFNQSEGYVLIEVPPQAMNGHFDASGNPLHEGDYISDTPSCGAATPTPTPTPPGPPAPVPEPVTMLLFGAGVAGVGYAVRKLRRKGDASEE